MEYDSDGLTSADAASRLAEYGPNRLPQPPVPGLALIFLRQFLSPFIYILLIAALVSLFLGQIPNTVFIIAVLLLNAVIGTVQEYSAQRSAAALRNMVRGQARVIRDGEVQQVDIEELVPGDLVSLSSGDKIPADLKLVMTADLSVDESLLTGESLAVAKNARAPVAASASIAERYDRGFAGTVVSRGRALGIVEQTGLNTELGRIADRVLEQAGEAVPLLIRIRRFTYQVAAAILIGILLLVGLMIAKGGYDPREMALMAIGLAVSAIPEGLPAALTVALAIGMSRMAKANVIIRKLVAVEALGSCTFICSDKTGTLTVNELTIREVQLPDGQRYRVTGEGVAPGGQVLGESAGRESEIPSEALRDLCITGMLANESQLDYAGGEWVSDGDIVDVAFLVFAKKLGLSVSGIRQRQQQIDAIPYESERAFSGSLNRAGDETRLFVKGSPEKLLAMCDRMRCHDEDVPIDREQLEQSFTAMASRGYRIIALAQRVAHAQADDAEAHLVNMVFLGMVGMIDPVRSDVVEAVGKCRAGGIEVAMITGDHPETAKAIAREIDLWHDGDPVVTGAMIREATAQGSAHADELIRPARVFARIEPAQKEQIVDSLIRDGHFVAVTGDGVNDAPALRHAHVGVAMGKRGTDVARETADLILTDDHFSSIVDGIEQGRIVYGNIRKVIALLIATGFSALVLFFLSVFAGLPMPLIAVQLLWLNLVANGFQDVALAFEPREGGELQRPPRRPSEPIFERHLIEHVLVIGGSMGVLAFLMFNQLLDAGESVESARNVTLMLMVLFGNIHALSSRSESRSLFSIRFWANPFLVLAVPIAQGIHIAAMYLPGLADVLQLAPISFRDWLELLGIAFLLLAIEELHKGSIRYRRRRREAGKPGHVAPA